MAPHLCIHMCTISLLFSAYHQKQKPYKYREYWCIHSVWTQNMIRSEVTSLKIETVQIGHIDTSLQCDPKHKSFRSNIIGAFINTYQDQQGKLAICLTMTKNKPHWFLCIMVEQRGGSMHGWVTTWIVHRNTTKWSWTILKTLRICRFLAIHVCFE